MEVPFIGQNFDGINTLLFVKKRFNLLNNVIAEGEKYMYYFGEPILAIDPTNEGKVYENDWVCPNDESLSKITISYNYFALNLTNYTIRTRMSPDDVNFPLGWKLEGSVDRISWTKLHSISDTNDLRSIGAYHTYECINSGYFSSFRLTMTQLNSNSSWLFHMNRVEFFGTIISTKNPFIQHTIKCMKEISIFNLFVISILFK